MLNCLAVVGTSCVPDAANGTGAGRLLTGAAEAQQRAVHGCHVSAGHVRMLLHNLHWGKAKDAERQQTELASRPLLSPQTGRCP